MGVAENSTTIFRASEILGMHAQWAWAHGRKGDIGKMGAHDTFYFTVCGIVPERKENSKKNVCHVRQSAKIIRERKIKGIAELACLLKVHDCNVTACCMHLYLYCITIEGE